MNEQRVVISNVFGDSNRGGTAITSVAITLIQARLPQADISLIPILSSDGDDVAFTHRHVAMLHPSVDITEPLVRERQGRIGRMRMAVDSLLILSGLVGRRSPTVARIRNAGLVVGKGGQVFRMRRGAGPLFGFWMDVLPLLLARRMRVPAALFSVTVGPYEEGSVAARFASLVLNRLQLVVVRDDRSADAARALGVRPERVRVAADSVFAIRAPTRAESDRAAKRATPGCRYGVITVLPWKDFDDVAAVVIDAVTEILNQGHVDEILVVMQTTEDCEASKQFRTIANDDRFRLVLDDLTPAELAALYSRARFVVAGRMHSAILALVAGTPAHPIRPKGLDKANEILGLIGLADLVCGIDASVRPLVASQSHLRDLLLRDCMDERAVRHRVVAATERAREQVEDVADELASLCDRDLVVSGERVGQK
jgi:polysaccharide pyruvyl transferase WcaK-like protein